MKRITLLLFVCFLFYTGIWGQQENALVTEGKQWAVWQMASSGECATTNLTLKGDTLISDKLYKKLWYTQNKDFTGLKLKEYCMRENEGKVYFYQYKKEKEYMWFDFNFKVGDTVTLDGSDFETSTAKVVAVRDTIFENIGDGVKRKCIYTEPSYTGVMVEGIGSLSFGIEEVLFETGVYDTALLCCHDKSTQIYQSGRFNTCFESMLGALRPVDSVNEKLTVQCTGQGELCFHWEAPLSFHTLSIYDEDGMLLCQHTIAAGDHQMILRDLPQGTCIYVLNSEEEGKISGKIYMK